MVSCIIYTAFFKTTINFFVATVNNSLTALSIFNPVTNNNLILSYRINHYPSGKRLKILSETIAMLIHSSQVKIRPLPITETTNHAVRAILILKVLFHFY